jgi:hypothetical protein
VKAFKEINAVREVVTKSVGYISEFVRHCEDVRKILVRVIASTPKIEEKLFALRYAGTEFLKRNFKRLTEYYYTRSN